MPTVTKDSRARIRTSKGDLLVQFLPEKAPRTVENFVKLAKKGFYDGLTFHRILSDFVVQGGCPNGDGSGGPGYTIRPEFNDTPHEKGVVSMARGSDPHSAGSQFFICTAPARYLDSRFAAFARVVEGVDVLDGIASAKVHDSNRWKERSTPLEPVYINGIDLIGVEFEPEPEPAPPAREASASSAAQDARGTASARDDGRQGDGGSSVAEGERSDGSSTPAPDAGSEGGEGNASRRGARGSRGRGRKASAESGGLFAGVADGDAEEAATRDAETRDVPTQDAGPSEDEGAENETSAGGDGDAKPRRPRRKAARARKPKDTQE